MRPKNKKLPKKFSGPKLLIGGIVIGVVLAKAGFRGGGLDRVFEFVKIKVVNPTAFRAARL